MPIKAVLFDLDLEKILLKVSPITSLKEVFKVLEAMESKKARVFSP